MKKTFAVSVCVAASLCAQADTHQTVTVGGEAIDKFVTTITFDGDDVVLGFADGSSVEAPMADVAVRLSYDGVADAMPSPDAGPAAPAPIYSLGGQYVGTSAEGLPKGVYISGGKKLVIK